MKYKKQMRLVCLLMLCTVLTGILQPAAADIQAERLLKRMGNLTPIQGTNLLIAQESKQNKWGLYDTDANLVVPLEYEKIVYVAYRFLNVASLPEETYKPTVKIPLDKLNSHALMTFDGKVLTDYIYGTFKAYSPLWAAGWVLENGTSKDYDFTPDKEHYFRIKRCDIFYCGEEETSESGGAEGSGDSANKNKTGSRLIASLTRTQFKDAFAHGEYLSVESRKSGITVYSKNAETVDINSKNLRSGVYGIKNWMLVELATGEMVMDGCSAVSEIQTENELLLLATRIDFQGRKLNTLITTKGEVIIPLMDADISSVSRGYAIITNRETGKKGLYSLAEKKQILSSTYDEIFENRNNIDRFNCHGFICVMKDEKYYNYNLETKKLVPLLKLKLDPDTELQRYGPTFYATTILAKYSKTQLISPDGHTKSLNCTISKSRGSGYILIAKFSGGSTVINWSGNNYLPQYYSSITITDDDRFILKTKNSGYELYRIPK